MSDHLEKFVMTTVRQYFLPSASEQSNIYALVRTELLFAVNSFNLNELSDKDKWHSDKWNTLSATAHKPLWKFAAKGFVRHQPRFLHGVFNPASNGNASANTTNGLHVHAIDTCKPINEGWKSNDDVDGFRKGALLLRTAHTIGLHMHARKPINLLWNCRWRGGGLSGKGVNRRTHYNLIEKSALECAA